VISSLAPVVALSTPGSAAHSIPASAPDATIAITISAVGLLPRASPTPAAAMAPTYSCPSAPMLKMRMRNAAAAARPVNSSGVAVTSMFESAPWPT
jgi:hypothetical protein